MLESTSCRADIDLDSLATRWLTDFQAVHGIRRYHLLCVLANSHYSVLGSRRLHAIADRLSAERLAPQVVIELLRFLGELDAIASLGAQGAASSSDPRLRSETAAHFGHPVAVLRYATRACLRAHG
jgi:hypothetical protein